MPAFSISGSSPTTPLERLPPCQPPPWMKNSSGVGSVDSAFQKCSTCFGMRPVMHVRHRRSAAKRRCAGASFQTAGLGAGFFAGASAANACRRKGCRTMRAGRRRFSWQGSEGAVTRDSMAMRMPAILTATGRQINRACFFLAFATNLVIHAVNRVDLFGADLLLYEWEGETVPEQRPTEAQAASRLPRRNCLGFVVIGAFWTATRRDGPVR